ncbi:ABC transporter substrate-binding protein [Clostridium sp. YIM B02515]|uniref:ABC transporter substrate-binding protein n=1 Tax=Clostridium rhizosphaerae TaxID=2803861 RepID=A0ABS1TJT3_9CLOT|nr:ABC transporter substrate-binding protein [Clostridium rhizosphaerae]MBL4938228.1 ABC transporter substrate-binding protein [Clostridium rhizosphaerae]
MKKKHLILFSFVLSFLLIGTLFTGCSSQASKTTVKVRLNEVTRSIFYAPFYAAMNQGFFKEEGLDIDLTTGEGADKTMQQVLSGSADIGFCGPEQVIYIYNQKREDYPVLFGQLTQKDGSFFVSRKEEKNFTWESLKGRTILGGRPGGVPEMALEYVLKNHGLTPGKDVNIITNVAFAAAPGAFKGGTGEYAALFEPSASMLTKDNSAYIVASVGKEAGVIPYTCYFTAKSYMDKNPDVLEKFTRAVYKGQLWVQKNSDADVAKSIKSFFPGTDEALIANVIKNYKSIDAFAPNLTLKAEDLTKLMDIIQSYKADLISERPPFSKIVNNSFADKAIKDVK